jgi:hypothetical protein
VIKKHRRYFSYGWGRKSTHFPIEVKEEEISIFLDRKLTNQAIA